jgi:hypothetical protein
MEQGAVHELPVGRLLSVDDRGVGLRATWRLDRGFVNLSLWRDDVCVDTFHLPPGEAARLVSFLVQGLADATTSSMAASPVLLPVEPAVPPTPPRDRLATAVAAARARASRVLESAAARLRGD